MTSRKLDLHEQANPLCRKCPRPERHQNTADGICKITVSAVDGEPVRCVGDWAARKIHFLARYLGIFANSMKNKWQGHIHYVEICSGPGRCIAKETGTETDGSALAVLGHEAFQYFDTATFVDYSPEVVRALNGRIQRHGLSQKAQAIAGDYNDSAALAAVLESRAATGLSLVFIDPTDCSLPFETVARVADRLQKADFIINIAVGTDANRNLERAILDQTSGVRSKYARFLGGDNFFRDADISRMAAQRQTAKLRSCFREAYCDALRGVGYQYFAQETVRNYYDLLFASRHATGLRLWKRAQQITPDDQRTFVFDE